MQTDSKKLASIFNHCCNKGFPFACYQLPGTKQINVIAQLSEQIDTYTNINELLSKEGFLFVPFLMGEYAEMVLIKPEIQGGIEAIIWSENDTELEVSFPKRKVLEMKKEAFLDYVEAAKRKIKKEKLQKIVVARCKRYKQPEDFHPIQFFEKLCKSYNKSFVSCVFIPNKGLWIGATPEVLLKFSQGFFTTYSLAGTQKYNHESEAISWGKKETEEQHIVTQFIFDTLKNKINQPVQVGNPETISAGGIAHLLSVFTVKDLPHFYWPELVEALHPTPAVAGMPRTEAIDFILEHEKNNRAYYAGYLGPLNINDKIELFVNLRCMEVQHKKLVFHVGCGITSGSKSDKEWTETKLKAQTLLNVL